ncbi:MAG: hypothetical protein KC501_21720 [Myxococcales bacterium]|nr:hypothetical protein [Myxococcales bacterium]
MAALAVPSEAELTQLSKNDLVGVVQRAVAKLQSQRGRIRKLAESAKGIAKTGALELADYGSAALGGAGVGMMMGTIQAKIAAGEEGYDEESLLVMGVDKDLAAAIAGAAAAYWMSTRGKPDDPSRKYAHYVKQGAMGALAAWAGRVAYEYALTPDEEEGGQQAA